MLTNCLQFGHLEPKANGEQWTCQRCRSCQSSEEARFKELMDRHHYLGAPPKIGESAFYAAVVDSQWVALSSFYACALKSSARDRWLGWHPRDRTPRLYLITNQSRFLVLKSAANLASRTLSLLECRIAHDVWDISLAFRPGRLTE